MHIVDHDLQLLVPNYFYPFLVYSWIFLYLSHYAPPFWQKVLFWFSVKINTIDLVAYNKSLVTTMGGYWVKTNSQTIQGIKLFKNKLFQAQGGQQGELFGSLSCPRRSNKCHQKHEYQGATLLLLKYKQTHQKDKRLKTNVNIKVKNSLSWSTNKHIKKTNVNIKVQPSLSLSTILNKQF